MWRIAVPQRRRTRVALLIGGAVALYLLVLSTVPRLFGGDDGAAARRTTALQAITKPNWGLVVPDEREALGRAVDETWRALQSYQFRYVTGLPADLAAGRSETDAGSSFVIDGQGRIAAQHDRSYISAASPANGGREERLEGYRVRTSEPVRDAKGRRIADAELVYQRTEPGAWSCERVEADRTPPPAPGLDFSQAGDAGFADIEGHRVRGFTFAAGAFGLRSRATVWIDTETLHVRRQEIESVLKGRREMWTYTGFDEPVDIRPPANIVCQDA